MIVSPILSMGDGMQTESGKGFPATEYLRGHWPLAMAAEGIVLAAEILFLCLTYYGVFMIEVNYFIIAVAAMDLLVLSPLLAGRIFLYDTMIADGSVVSLSLLFRYYRYGYSKSVMWRLGIWMRTAAGMILISLLPLALHAARTVLQKKGIFESTDLLSVAFVCGIYFVFACGAVMIYLWLSRYSLAVHLLPYSSTAGNAFRSSRTLLHGRGFLMIRIRLQYSVRFLLCPLILPWFYLTPCFRVAMSRFSRRKIGKFPEKKSREVLHMTANHGKIKKI